MESPHHKRRLEEKRHITQVVHTKSLLYTVLEAGIYITSPTSPLYEGQAKRIISLLLKALHHTGPVVEQKQARKSPHCFHYNGATGDLQQPFDCDRHHQRHLRCLRNRWRWDNCTFKNTNPHNVHWKRMEEATCTPETTMMCSRCTAIGGGGPISKPRPDLHMQAEGDGFKNDCPKQRWRRAKTAPNTTRPTRRRRNDADNMSELLNPVFSEVMVLEHSKNTNNFTFLASFTYLNTMAQSRRSHMALIGQSVCECNHPVGCKYIERHAPESSTRLPHGETDERTSTGSHHSTPRSIHPHSCH